MSLPSRTLRILIAFVAVLAFALGTRALADEPDAPEKKEERTDRIFWAAGEAPQGEMHVFVEGVGEDGRAVRKVLQLRDGMWIAVDEETPVAVQAERAARPVPANPLQSVLRWLVGESLEGRATRDPLRAWFDGGPDVPMAGLRDALAADGWTADSLRAWLSRNLAGALTEIPAPYVAPQPPRGHWFEVLRGDDGCDCRRRASRGCDCECHRPRCGDCGCRQARPACDGRCGARCGARCDGGGCGARRDGCRGGRCGNRGDARCGGRCGGECGGGGCGNACRGGCDRAPAPRCDSCGGRRVGALPWMPADVRVRGRAYVIYNDGSGWKHREIPVPEARHDVGVEPDVESILRELFEGRVESGSKPGSARVIVEGLDLLPPELMDEIPPEVLESVLKEMRGLGLGDLLGGEAKRSCDDCPKAKAGTCGGDCKECPKPPEKTAK